MIPLILALLAYAPSNAAATNAPSSAEICRASAMSSGRLIESEAMTLCAGSPSGAAPVACFLRARDERGLSKQQALGLCFRAPSVASVLACHETAELDGRLTRSQAIGLCAQSAHHAAPVRCVQEALGYFALGAADAAALCVRADSTAPVDCYRRSTETGMSRANALELCSVPESGFAHSAVQPR